MEKVNGEPVPAISIGGTGQHQNRPKISSQMASDAEELVMIGWAEGRGSDSYSEDDYEVSEVRQVPDRSCDRPAEVDVRPTAPEPVPAEQGAHQAAMERDEYPGVGRYAEIQLLPANPTAEEFQRWFDRQGWGLQPVRCPVVDCNTVFRVKQRVPASVSIQRAPHSFIGHCRGMMPSDRSHDDVFYRMEAVFNRGLFAESGFQLVCRQHLAYRCGAAPLPIKCVGAFSAFEASVRRGELQLGPDSADFYQVWGDVLEGRDVRDRAGAESE